MSKTKQELVLENKILKLEKEILELKLQIASKSKTVEYIPHIAYPPVTIPSSPVPFEDPFKVTCMTQ